MQSNEGREMRNAIARIVKVSGAALLALALVALISACGGSSSGSDDAAGHSDGGVVDSGDELVITMRTEDFKFVPESITIKVGQTVRLRLDNHDQVLHDYTTDEADFIVLGEDGAAHDDHEVVAAAVDGDDGDAVASHDDDDDDDHDADSDAVSDMDSDMDMDPEAQVSLQPLHIAAEGDEHGELVFEATEVGEYVFYCSVPGHQEAGMVGTIIIEE